MQARAGAKLPSPQSEPESLADYVLTVEGDEPLRMLHDAKEDLHDTIFLELENGGTLDLFSVKFIDDGDSDVIRTELHFARLLNGQPAIDPESEKVIFHAAPTRKRKCRTARMPCLSAWSFVPA